MNQSRLESLEETIINIVSGFFIAILVQLAFFPMFGIRISIGSNLALTGIFTIFSIVRSYAIRRLYNKHRGFIVRAYLNWRNRL